MTSGTPSAVPPPPTGTLSRRVIEGGLWVTALSLTVHLLAALRLVALARLLSPHDFGLVGTAMVVISLFESVTIGLYLALIQRQDSGRELFDTAWTLGLIRGGLVSGLLVVLAPFVGWFVGSDEVVPIVRVMMLVPLLRGLTNIGVVEFRKELTFRPYYLLHTSGVIAEFSVAVPLAFWLGNAWALVAGWLAHVAVQVAMSYRLHAYRPRLALRWTQVRELFDYGRWVLGSQTIGWLITNGGHAVVGRVVGVQALGLYHLGWRIAFLPTTEITGVVGGVTVAAYAKLREARTRVRLAYLRVLTVVTLVAVPIAVGIGMYGPETVRLLLGRRWVAAVVVVQVLAMAALFRVVGATTAPVFQGLGRPRLQSVSALVELAALAALLVPLTLREGPAGTATAVNAAALCGAVTSLWLVSRLLDIRRGALVPILGSPLLACLPFVLLRGVVLRPAETVLGLAGAILVSAALYLATLLVLHRLGVCHLDRVVPAGVRAWRPSRMWR